MRSSSVSERTRAAVTSESESPLLLLLRGVIQLSPPTGAERRPSTGVATAAAEVLGGGVATAAVVASVVLGSGVATAATAVLGGGVAGGVSEEGSSCWVLSGVAAEAARAGVSVGVGVGVGVSIDVVGGGGIDVGIGIGIGFRIGGVGGRFRAGFDGDGCGVGGVGAVGSVGSASASGAAWARTSSGYLPVQPRRLGVNGSRLCT